MVSHCADGPLAPATMSGAVLTAPILTAFFAGVLPSSETICLRSLLSWLELAVAPDCEWRGDREIQRFLGEFPGDCTPDWVLGELRGEMFLGEVWGDPTVSRDCPGPLRGTCSPKYERIAAIPRLMTTSGGLLSGLPCVSMVCKYGSSQIVCGSAISRQPLTSRRVSETSWLIASGSARKSFCPRDSNVHPSYPPPIPTLYKSISSGSGVGIPARVLRGHRGPPTSRCCTKALAAPAASYSI